MAITSIDEEIDTVELALAPGSEDAINDLVARREELGMAVEALREVLGRHPAALDAREAKPIRRYRTIN